MSLHELPEYNEDGTTFDVLDYLGGTVCEVCTADLWQGDVWYLPILDGPPGTTWAEYVAIKVCMNCLDRQAEDLERERVPDTGPEDTEWWDRKRGEMAP